MTITSLTAIKIFRNYLPALQSTDPAGTTIFKLFGKDLPNSTEQLQFSLVSGVGSTNNDLFTIVGNELKSAQPVSVLFDRYSFFSFRVRAEVIDNPSLSIENTFVFSGFDLEYANPVPLPTLEVGGAFPIYSYTKGMPVNDISVFLSWTLSLNDSSTLNNEVVSVRVPQYNEPPIPSNLTSYEDIQLSIESVTSPFELSDFEIQQILATSPFQGSGVVIKKINNRTVSVPTDVTITLRWTNRYTGDTALIPVQITMLPLATAGTPKTWKLSSSAIAKLNSIDNLIQDYSYIAQGKQLRVIEELQITTIDGQLPRLAVSRYASNNDYYNKLIETTSNIDLTNSYIKFDGQTVPIWLMNNGVPSLGPSLVQSGNNNFTFGQFSIYSNSLSIEFDGYGSPNYVYLSIYKPDEEPDNFTLELYYEYPDSEYMDLYQKFNLNEFEFIDTANISNGGGGSGSNVTNLVTIGGKAVGLVSVNPTATEVLVNGQQLPIGSVLKNSVTGQKFLKVEGSSTSFVSIELSPKVSWDWTAESNAAWAVLQSL